MVRIEPRYLRGARVAHRWGRGSVHRPDPDYTVRGRGGPGRGPRRRDHRREAGCQAAALRGARPLSARSTPSSPATPPRSTSSRLMPATPAAPDGDGPLLRPAAYHPPGGGGPGARDHSGDRRPRRRSARGGRQEPGGHEEVRAGVHRQPHPAGHRRDGHGHDRRGSGRAGGDRPGHQADARHPPPHRRGHADLRLPGSGHAARSTRRTWARSTASSRRRWSKARAGPRAAEASTTIRAGAKPRSSRRGTTST